jgi:hypothetical protein
MARRRRARPRKPRAAQPVLDNAAADHDVGVPDGRGVRGRITVHEDEINALAGRDRPGLARGAHDAGNAERGEREHVGRGDAGLDADLALALALALAPAPTPAPAPAPAPALARAATPMSRPAGKRRPSPA